MSDELSRGEITIVLETGSYTAKVGYADSWTGPTFIKTLETAEKWPVAQRAGNEAADIQDWNQLGDFWRELMHDGGISRRPLSESPLMFNVPWGMHHRSHLEQLAQLFFEDLQVPALYMANQPLMALYSCGAVNGLVVDIGNENTTLVPILDSNVQYSQVRRLPVGGKKCLEMQDESWKNIWTDERQVNIGHHIYDMVRSMDPDRRQLLFDHILVTGGAVPRGNFRGALDEALSSKFISISDFCGDDQPKSFKFLRIPDYLTEMKGKEEHASWFGGAIVSKLVFPGGDMKGFLSRTDYNEHGPSVAWEKSY